jgi:spore coat polysaccharide biosynthesis protein SpsF
MKNKMKIVATIEARMKSTILPQKILLDIGGKPAFEYMTNRVRQSKLADEIFVASTIDFSVLTIIDLCKKIVYKFFRGNEEDVLIRVLDAARSVNANIIVELTGDCPFIDPEIIDNVIEFYFSADYDYAINGVERSFPDGLDTQVFSVKKLEKISKMTQDSIGRVHVSRYFNKKPKKFKFANLIVHKELTWPDLRLTFDEDVDYQLLRSIDKKLKHHRGMFSARDVISLLKHEPDLIEINKHVKAKELNDG